jgi:hypothetical protein
VIGAVGVVGCDCERVEERRSGLLKGRRRERGRRRLDDPNPTQNATLPFTRDAPKTLDPTPLERTS